MKKRVGILYGKPIIVGDKNDQTVNEVYLSSKEPSGGNVNQGNIEGAELGYPNFNIIKAYLKRVDAGTTIYHFSFDGIEYYYNNVITNENYNAYVIVNEGLYNKILNLLNKNVSIYYTDVQGGGDYASIMSSVITIKNKTIILTNNITPLTDTITMLYISCNDIPM